MSSLFIVESPNKIKKIKSFLDNQYNVKASVGHIRDLNNKELGIDIKNDFEPKYEVLCDKKDVVSSLRKAYKNCSVVYLATDYDREGESIAWHIKETLKIPQSKLKRIVFTEITKSAIKKSIQKPTKIDMNMFYAQQARRILDRLLGYKITPLLWKNLSSSYQKGKSLSAGRVQSVVNHLLQVREKEITDFESASHYTLEGSFKLKSPTKESKHIVFHAKANSVINEKQPLLDFLELCKTKNFQIVSMKKSTREIKPRPPFTTSTLQQEASVKFHMSPKVTMSVAQKLYEGGYITYMRTDSVVLSKESLGSIKEFVVNKWGEKEHVMKIFANKSKNAQEAHEAIRPTNMNLENLQNNETLGPNEKKLYKLIWQRTIASQMKSCFIQCIILMIGETKEDKPLFEAKAEKVKELGFRKVYTQTKEGGENEEEDEENKKRIGLNNHKEFFEYGKVSTKLSYDSIKACEKKTRHNGGRYTEANLVKTLDKLGVGRPSTFSSMVNIVQQRDYAVRGNIEGTMIDVTDYTLKKGKDTLLENTYQKKFGEEKNKLIPTALGKIVDGYLFKEFPNLLDTSFTSSMEDLLDSIAKGEKDWISIVKMIYNRFSPKILELEKASARAISYSGGNQNQKRAMERTLGEASNGRTLLACMGKYGPMVISRKENSKDLFAPLKIKTIEEVTLEEAEELFRYPIELGDYNNEKITLMKGKYGLYCKYNGGNISIPTDTPEEEITLDLVIKLVKEKESNSQKQRTVTKDIVIKHGKYGYYICHKGKTNVSLPKKYDPTTITKEDCLKCIEEHKKKKTSGFRKK